MKLLSIDPGKTTGIAYADLDKKSVFLIAVRDIKNLYVILSHIKLNDIDLTIVESSPSLHPDREQDTFHANLLNWLQVNGFRCIQVSPGTWKPVAKARGWDHPSALTQHESDAYNMIRHHVWTVFKKDIGELRCQDVENLF